MAETAPSKGGPESQGHREGEVVVKPNTARGSVGQARCRHQKVVQNLYTTLRGSAAQSSWCIHHPAFVMGECATAGIGAGRPDGPI